MKWDAVLAAIGDTLMAVPELTDLFVDAIQVAGSDDHRVPLLEYLLVADGIQEQWAPVTIQFSVWTISLADLIATERQLFRLFHAEIPASFGGMTMWAEYIEGSDLTVPNRDGYFGRACRFRLTPLRSLYEPSPYF